MRVSFYKSYKQLSSFHYRQSFIELRVICIIVGG